MMIISLSTSDLMMMDRADISLTYLSTDLPSKRIVKSTCALFEVGPSLNTHMLSSLHISAVREGDMCILKGHHYKQQCSVVPPPQAAVQCCVSYLLTY